MDDDREPHRPLEPLGHRGIRLPLLVFAVGAVLVGTGDYLYGTTYYTDQPDADARFLVSGFLGYAGGALYLWGARGYQRVFLRPDDRLRALVGGGLAFFAVGVATVHVFTSAIMVAYNQNLLTPGLSPLRDTVDRLEEFYRWYFAPMLLALVLGYGALFIAVLRRRTSLPRWVLVAHPLPQFAGITALAEIDGFPIALRSPSVAAVVFNVVLLAALRTTDLRHRGAERTPTLSDESDSH
ncbi:MAG: DUF6796 family protein [Phycicoccus sp.]